MLGYLVYRIKCILLRKVVRIGKGVVFSATTFEGKNTLFSEVNIANSYVGYGTYIQKHSDIQYTLIGRYCSIADNVHTCIGTHPTSLMSTYPAFYYDTTDELGYSFHKGRPVYDVNKYPDEHNDYQIKIGNDVWIGSHVMIMAGVSIGDGAIVAAGAVVTKSIPPYQIWGGVPAKFIKNRFDNNCIEKVQKLKWWNKSEEWIRTNIDVFRGELFSDVLDNIKD